MLILKGEPSSMPSGTGARVTPPQHGQCPAYRSTRVTTGRTTGTSILSYRPCSTWSASVSADRQCAQDAAFAVTVSSGSQTSGRPPPLRPRLPWRGPIRFAFSDWFAFCPFDGGRLELSGVFGGSPSFASSSATRAISAWTCVQSARINASFSAWLRLLRFGGWVTPLFRVDSTVTVSNTFSRAVRPSLRPQRQDCDAPGMSNYCGGFQ